MAVGSQFAQYINPLLAVLKSLGGSARPAEAKAAVADHLRLSDDVLEERLESGSSRFEFQCKRYKGSVGPSVVRDFRGAVMGRADKGLILTTGSFTEDSKREAVRDGVPPIELVDGNKLVQLFEQLELGLGTAQDLRSDRVVL